MKLKLVSVQGHPIAMGEHFGEECRDSIHELYERRLRQVRLIAGLVGERVRVSKILELSELTLPKIESYDKVDFQELIGLARGSRLSLAKLIFMQGATDFIDLLVSGRYRGSLGCTAAMMNGSVGSELMLAQTWDLFTDNLPFVRLVHRRPLSAPETWSLTVTGGLSMVGLNSEGLGVGTTNLVVMDAQLGVPYLSILHSCLKERSVKRAEMRVVEALRMGGHFYMLGDRSGGLAALECSARRVSRHKLKRAYWVETNHAVSKLIKEQEALDPDPQSTRRRQRLLQLIRSQKRGVRVEDLKRMFSDHHYEGEEICVHGDLDGVSTNACVIVCPGSGVIHACRGQAHVGEWRIQSFNAP
ncbi:MAG: C45 family autoproteolytic acyltransferase/hydrolase [Planctomycetota bacterium]|nr:C45 family autoproteolytic acyltransferase/hydrolase [Planctomycetota bacterium]